jgi:hypothetical protein
MEASAMTYTGPTKYTFAAYYPSSTVREKLEAAEKYGVFSIPLYAGGVWDEYRIDNAGSLILKVESYRDSLNGRHWQFSDNKGRRWWARTPRFYNGGHWTQIILSTAKRPSYLK